jgi:hypothetical protein
MLFTQYPARRYTMMKNDDDAAEVDYHLEINSAVSDKGFVIQLRRSGEIAHIQAQLSNSLESLNKTKGSVIKVSDFDSDTCVRCLQDGADVFILCGTGSLD